MTPNNNEIDATLNGFITVFIMSSAGSNSFRFTNFVSYNDVLFAYDVALYDVILFCTFSV